MIYFSKFGQEYIVGQQNLYEDPCDEWLDLVNNKLTSPNFPIAYDPLTECKWNITAPQGHYVTLDFEMIDVSIFYFIHTTIFWALLKKLSLNPFQNFKPDPSKKDQAPG